MGTKWDTHHISRPYCLRGVKEETVVSGGGPGESCLGESQVSYSKRMKEHSAVEGSQPTWSLVVRCGHISQLLRQVRMEPNAFSTTLDHSPKSTYFF